MLKLSLVTPEKKLLENEEVENLLVPGFEGQLNILEGHADFMTTLETGALHFTDSSGNTRSYSVCWGYCEVSNDEVTVLAETAESQKEINVERAEEAFRRAQEKLEQAGLAVEELEKYQRKLQRADLRLTLARAYRENN